MEKYDLIVIGSGPAGQRAAIQAAKFGKHVALVEKLEVVGGTAINTGTIPSKTIREAVLHLSGFYYQSIYGVNYRVKDQITMGDLSFRAQLEGAISAREPDRRVAKARIVIVYVDARRMIVSRFPAADALPAYWLRRCCRNNSHRSFRRLHRFDYRNCGGNTRDRVSRRSFRGQR